MAYKDPETDVHERLASLEAKFNGGPGQSPICKVHEKAVEEIKADLKAIREMVTATRLQLKYWAGGFACLLCILTIAAPVARELAVKLLMKNP